MKLNFNKTVAISFVATASLLLGCVDNEKDLFDAEKVKEMYQNSFPVKDIDPNMDWKTTAEANVNVTVNEDLGTDYKVQIFDANPLSPINKAKLLAEGYANKEMAFQTTIDYPKALNTVFVARVDEKGRYLVKSASIEYGNISAHFGNFGSSQVTSRATTRADNFTVAPIEAPYTEQEIKEKLAGATEIKQGWDLGAKQNWDIEKYKDPIFNTPDNQPRFFKITTPKTNILNSSGSAIIKVMVASKLTLTESPKMSGSIEIIVLNGGEVAIEKEFNLTQSSNITVMPGGKVSGKKIHLTNVSTQNINYNAGEVELEEIAMNQADGLFYNGGTLDVDYLNITNTTTKLVNLGKASIVRTNTQTTIENGCYLNVKNFNGVLRLGASCSAIIDTYNKDRGDNPDMTLGENSILYIKEAYLTDESIHGPSKGYALVKIEEIKALQNFKSEGSIYYEIEEIDDKITNDSWANSFCKALENSNGTISKFGESPITIPAGDCTGEGNTPNASGDEVVIDPQSYTYAFEDNYPAAGDYDFNDIILDVKSACVRNRTNQISKIQYYITLRAVGATKKLGAGLRLIGVDAGEVAAIEFEDTNNMRSTLDGSIFENVINESNKDIVIPLFGDAHKVYGEESNRKMLNTNKNSKIEMKPYVLKVIITLADQTNNEPLITNANLDFFIAYSSMNPQAKRTEVHLYEFRENGATDNGNVHNKNLEVAGKLTWGICVPDFNYPTETTVITTAYPEFSQWATTGGINNTFKEWYKHPVQTDTDKYIFQ